MVAIAQVQRLLRLNNHLERVVSAEVAGGVVRPVG
jgi:hypothetical protein